MPSISGAPLGIVTPRYAYVLEQTRGVLVVLDLLRERVAARLAVGARPNRLAVHAATLWIAHVGSSRLTRVSVATPTKPQLLANVDAGAAVAGLVANPERHSVFVAFRGSGAVSPFTDGNAHARLVYKRMVVRGALVGLALAPPDFLIAADRRGTLHLLHEQSGRQVSRLHLTAGIEAIDVYGGWLVAILPRALALVGVPDGSMRTSVPFGARVSGFAWSVL